MDSSEVYGIYEEREVLHQPCVLYQDYSGFWSPISALYWSTSSRILVSRHPFSCIEEIISQYCPQCLSRYMEDEVKTSQNRCPACFQCPCCWGLLSRLVDATDGSSFSCTGCGWRNIKVNATLSPSTDEIFNGILKSLRDEEICNAPSQPSRKMVQPDTRWKLTDLESSLQSKSMPWKRSNQMLCDTPVSSTNDVKSDKELTTLAQRLKQPGLQPPILADLGPLAFHLRSKRTVRCRRDVEEGKMSILVQPKLFPLEGDSSQKLQRGKWFVKDSSAVHEVPSMIITKLPDSQSLNRMDVSYLHLTVTNPKDFEVKVRLVEELYSTQGYDPLSASTNRSEPFACKTGDLLLNSEGDITFDLGAFEDELLRDDDDDDLEEGAGNSPKSAEDAQSDLSARGWSCTVSHNVARLILSVRSGKTSVVDSSLYAMLLTMHTEMEDESNKKLPVTSLKFHTMIAFPVELV